MGDLLKREAAQFFQRVTQQAAQIAAGFGKVALTVNNSDSALFKQAAKALFALPQSGFHVFALGDILGDTDGLFDMSVCIAQCINVDIDPYRAAVLVQVAFFDDEVINLAALHAAHIVEV